MFTGDRIRRRRIKLGYSQQQLADLVEVSKSTINLIENNKRNPSITVISEIADALYTTTDYLLCRTDNEQLKLNRKIPFELQNMIEFIIAKYNKDNNNKNNEDNSNNNKDNNDDNDDNKND